MNQHHLQAGIREKNVVSQVMTPLMKPSFGIFDLDVEGVYIQFPRLYFAYYGQVPNIKTVFRVDSDAIRQRIEICFKDQILRKHYHQILNREKTDMEDVHTSYLMKDGILININSDNFNVAFGMEEQQAQEWAEMAAQMPRVKRKKKNNSISLVTEGMHGLTKTAMRFKMPDLDLKLNYNDDFIGLHEKLLAELCENDSNGLYLFHGSPGTGKTTYLKYLIHQLEKDVIFMSPKLAGSLDAPELTGFLIENKNAIIVIEDAEELIHSRDAGRDSSISTLLNLTDGLLGECLSIQIIATFNTPVVNIDKALLRKGRLKARYEFKELSLSKTAGLLAHLGMKNHAVAKSMSLSDIYNMDETNYDTLAERSPIGFVK